MKLETIHRNRLTFQLSTDHFDVVHAAENEAAAIVTSDHDAHCECFGIRDGSVGTLNVFCDGRAQIFGGSIDEVHLYGDAALSYYGYGCSQGTIKELHVYQHALLKTDLKSLQHLLDIGSEIRIDVGATICIGDQYYTKKIEQTTDTFFNNIKTVEKVIEMMDDKIKAHVRLPETHVDVKHENGRIVADIKIDSHTCNSNSACGSKCRCEPQKKQECTIDINSGIENGPYTVRQLIEALQKCKNQDAPVNAYLLKCGARLPITYVDDTFENNRMVDLNVDDDYLFDKEKGDDPCEDRQ